MSSSEGPHSVNSKYEDDQASEKKDEVQTSVVTDQDNEREPEYRLYKRRFVGLVGLVSGSMSTWPYAQAHLASPQRLGAVPGIHNHLGAKHNLAAPFDQRADHPRPGPYDAQH